MIFLEDAIKELMEKIYKCKFTGYITAEKKGHWFFATIHPFYEIFNGQTYAKECDTPEEFLDFLKHEFEKNNLLRAKHFKTILHGSHEGKERN